MPEPTLKDVAEAHAAEAVAVDQRTQRCRQQVLVAAACVGAEGAGKGRATAADDRDAPQCGSDQHDASFDRP